MWANKGGIHFLGSSRLWIRFWVLLLFLLDCCIFVTIFLVFFFWFKLFVVFIFVLTKGLSLFFNMTKRFFI